jgi:heme-degrading monooxygenase HmoA
MAQQDTQSHGDKVFVFTEIITPIEGHADDILSASLKSTETMKGQPGLIQVLITKSEKANGELSTITVWESKNAFQDFLKSDEMAEVLKSDAMKDIKSWMSNYQGLMSDLVDGWHG